MSTNEVPTYFNVKLEFDKEKFDKIVDEAIQTGKVGYVCSVESNNLTVANTDTKFLKVLNGALVNNCDGSILAKVLSLIYKRKLESYIGADIFIKYIGMCKYRQFFLGNTPEVLSGLKNNLSKLDPEIKNMRFETLPFRSVDEFDYKSIAHMINEDNPDIIWVSLGAPKWMLKLRLEWLHRAFEQPKKNVPRYWNFIKILPILAFGEKSKSREVSNV